jgi:hypothetical protein
MVQAGTLFEYLAAFITVLLAIAVGDMAVSLHRLLRARRRVKWHPLPLTAAFIVLLILLTNFFAIWRLTETERITFLELCWLLTPQFLYFLAASAVLPDEIPAKGLKLFDFYDGERRYLYTLLLLAVVAEVIDGTVRLRLFEQNPQRYFSLYLPLNLISLLSLLAMVWRSEKWVHWTALGMLLVVAYFGILDWAVEGAAAVVPA